MDAYDQAFERAVLALQSAIPNLDDERATEVVTAISLAVLEVLKHSLKEQQIDAEQSRPKAVD